MTTPLMRQRVELARRMRTTAAILALWSVEALVFSSCHSLNSCDKEYWRQYEKQFEGQEKACIYSSQRRLATFNDLVGQVSADADRLSQEFEARHYVLPDDHPLSQRVQAALTRLKPVLAKRSARGCSQDRPFPMEAMTAHVIAHDAPVAFSFPNGKIYFTVGLVDPEFPWSARTDDELLGVVGHEMIHLSDWHVVAHWAIIRAALADNSWKLPIRALTFLTPVRVTLEPLPLEADTFDERIEFLADSGASELLFQMGSSAKPYLDFVSRLATYPYDFELGQSDRKELLGVRAACLTRCLSPTQADVRMDNGTVRKLSAQEQYVLCANGFVSLPRTDWELVRSWLDAPDGAPLNDLPERLSGRGRSKLEEMVCDKANGIEEPKSLALALVGKGAQMQAACAFGGESRAAR